MVEKNAKRGWTRLVVPILLLSLLCVPRSAGGEKERPWRFHLTFESGLFISPGIPGLRASYRRMGFGDDRTTWNGQYIWDYPGYDTTPFPTDNGKIIYALKDIKLDWSVSNLFALGLMFVPPRQNTVQGYRVISKSSYPYSYYREESGILSTTSLRVSAYFLTASLMPMPETLHRKDSFRLGAGVGFSDICLDFVLQDEKKFSYLSPCVYACAAVNYHIFKNMSLGMSLDYQFLPFTYGPFKLTGKVVSSIHPNSSSYKMMPIDFPGGKLNFGGFSFGLSLGFHL